MIELLMAAQLSCADAYWILDGLDRADLTELVRTDMKLTVIESMPDDCNREDHETRPRNR